MDKFDQWLVDTVENVGWAVLSVAPRKDSDDPEEWFSYTIGLTKTFGWPELICFGLGSDTRKNILNDAVAECRERKTPPKVGLKLSEVIKGYDVLLADGAQIPDQYFGTAYWYARHSGLEGVPRLQVLWPDKEGRFPGEAGCEDGVEAEQRPFEGN